MPKRPIAKKKGKKPRGHVTEPSRVQSPITPQVKTLGNGEGSARSNNLYLFLGLWVAFSLVTLTFTNYSWMVPSLAQRVPFQQSYGASLILFLAMVLFAHFFLGRGTASDFPKTATFWGMLASLGLATFLCFYEADKPMGSYSIDTSFGIAHVRESTDLNNYHSLFGAYYGVEPLWEYAAIGLSLLFPSASAILVQRLANGLLDLAAIYFLYLAGKQVGGRRMGLFAAALGAVSKAYLVKIVSGYNISAMSLGMALALLFTLRLWDNRKIGDFLKWGLSIGFLAYCGSYFQPMLPFFTVFTFAFFFFTAKGDMPGPLAWISLAGLCVFHLYCSNGFSSTNWVDGFLTTLGPFWAKGLLALFLGMVAYQAGMGLHRKTNPLWAGWTAGAWCASLMAAPFLADPTYLSRIKQFSLASHAGLLSGPYLLACLQRVLATFQYIFWIGGDRSDMGLPADSFFSYPEVILIALGLAFSLARPGLKTFFLVLAAGAGASVHFIAAETHSARLMSCTPPFLLIGAYGLSELVSYWDPSKLKRRDLFLVPLLLVVFWVWAAWGDWDRVYRQWVDKPVGLMAVRDQAIQDVDKGYQVYLAPEYSDGSLSVLYEGHPVHLLNRTNEVVAGSDEEPTDVVVFMAYNEAEKKTFEEAFPRAKWSDVRNSALRCQVPFADLSDPRQSIFTTKRVAAPYWRRTFSETQAGLNFAFLNWEDRTANVYDPVPPQVYMDWEGVRYRGTIHLSEGGEVLFHGDAVNRTLLKVDGKVILDMTFYRNGPYWAPGKEETWRGRLGPGDHRVEVTTCFQRSMAPPGITLQTAGKPAKSLWSSFDF